MPRVVEGPSYEQVTRAVQAVAGNWDIDVWDESDNIRFNLYPDFEHHANGQVDGIGINVMGTIDGLTLEVLHVELIATEGSGERQNESKFAGPEVNELHDQIRQAIRAAHSTAETPLGELSAPDTPEGRA